MFFDNSTYVNKCILITLLAPSSFIYLPLTTITTHSHGYHPFPGRMALVCFGYLCQLTWAAGALEWKYLLEPGRATCGYTTEGSVGFF